MERALLLQELQTHPQGVRVRPGQGRHTVQGRRRRDGFRRRVRLRPEDREPQPPVGDRALRRRGDRDRRHPEGCRVHGRPAHRPGRPPVLRADRQEGRAPSGHQAPQVPGERRRVGDQGLREQGRDPHHHRGILLRREVHRKLPGQRGLPRHSQEGGPGQELRWRSG